MRRLLLGWVLLLSVHLPVQAVEGLLAGDMARIRDMYRGRPLVIHVWSLTCAPCLVELPQWAQRIKSHPEIAFVFISTDGLRQAKVLERRLASAGVRPTRSLTYGEDFVERLQYDIAPEWRGELPRTELNTRLGTRWVSTGPTRDADFSRWLANLDR